MQHFCTMFDQRYLTRGLQLYRSLRIFVLGSPLWVLCLDLASEALLRRLALPDLQIVPLTQLEAQFPALAAAKANRQTIEYYFTLTPHLPLALLDWHPQIASLTYLDADILLYSDPQPVFAQIAGATCAIVPHRFPQHLRRLARLGTYNVGWQTFRRSPAAFACLNWWAARCREWCYDRYERGRFADQKYLDSWPTRFPGVAVITHPGVNLAPWNLDTHTITASAAGLRIDGWPLVAYHFHGLRVDADGGYDPQFATYRVVQQELVRSTLYDPYVAQLQSLAYLVPPAAPVRQIGAGNARRAPTQR